MKGGERNYQYVIREVDENVHAVIPGKFSLSFSLAVNAFKRLTGQEPAKDVRLVEYGLAQSYVGLTRHAALVRNALRNDHVRSASSEDTTDDFRKIVQ